jgi:hypothetical protein
VTLRFQNIFHEVNQYVLILAGDEINHVKYWGVGYSLLAADMVYRRYWLLT